MEVTISDGVAVVALLLSVYTFWRQRKGDELAAKLNTKLIAREEADELASKAANLSANFVDKGQHRYEFRVYNKGRGTAEDVSMEVLAGDSLIDDQDIQDKFPYPALETHQSISMLARVHLGSPRRAVVKLTWKDAAGGGEKVVTSDVF